MKKNVLVYWFWKIHPKVYRWSGGRIGNRILGLPVLLLSTLGRKSGLMRTKALLYLPFDGNYVVIASNLGDARHPDWWLNLQSDPAASVQVGREEIPVLAREAQGEERETLWQNLVHIAPVYNSYRGRTSRRIPVVVLEKRRPQ